MSAPMSTTQPGGRAFSLSSRTSSLLRLAWSFLRRDALIDLSYRTAWAFRLAGLFFSCWSLFFLGRAFGATSPFMARFGGDYFGFALLGVAFTMMTGTALSGTARRTREAQLLGTLEPLFASPAPPFGIILMFSLYPMLVSCLQALAFLGAGTAFFGARFALDRLPAALLAVALAVAVHLALGVISASLVLVIRRGDPVSWVLSSLTYLFSGVVYPVEVLPDFLRPLSLFLPATHALELIRCALLDAPGTPLPMRPILALAAFCAVLWPLAVLCLRSAVRHARREGTLPMP